MSAERERVIIARTKLQCAARLISEARAELQGTALVAKHPLMVAIDELTTAAPRTVHLAEQTVKRYP